MRTYPGGLLVCEHLRVDSVELENEFVHQVCVQSGVSSEEDAVLQQLLVKTVCSEGRNQTKQTFSQCLICSRLDPPLYQVG